MFGTGATTGGSLFGTPAASSATTTPGLFGTTTGGNNLFGGGAANTSTNPTPAVGGSLFGAAAAKPATGGSLFGNTTTNTTTPAVGGSLFGAPAASSAPAATASTTTPSLFGNAPAATTTTPAVGGGLFGGTSTAATSTPAAGGGLFGGASAATTSAPAAGGGLFGGATTTTSAPATGGSLFGGAAATPNASAAGGGLFGGGATNTTSAPAAGGLFGGATTTTSAPATGGGLFGAASASTSAPAASGGLFGAGTASAKPGLFGGAPTTTAPTGLGSVPMTAQQSNAQQAVKLDWSNLMPFTKFYELSDSARNEIEQAENYIMGEIQKSEQLAALFPEQREMVTSVAGDAELMERRLLTTGSFLQSDFAMLESLAASQRADDQAACLSTRTLDLIRLPHSQRSTIAGGAPGQNLGASIAPQSSSLGASVQNSNQQQQSFLPLPTHSSTTTAEVDITGNTGMVAYFTKQTNEMELKLERFNRTVDEVEASLRSVEATAQNRGPAQGGLRGMDVTGGVGGRQDSRRLNQTLRSFYDALGDVSVRVVEAKEGLRALKTVSHGGPAARR